MEKQLISQRHKPSIWSYIRQNVRVTFAITEKAELMVALGWIFLSTILGLVGGLSAPQIIDVLTPWNLRVALGLAIFVVVQFGIITPFRMWREAIWVANVENFLEDLCDSHDAGVELLNAHVGFMYNNPDCVPGSEKAADWVNTWIAEVCKWTDETQKKLSRFYPVEGRRFKHIVVYQHILREDNLNMAHKNYRNMLLRRLEMLSSVIGRHQPRLLPD